ncbi:MAG: hypothetical protein ACUVWP_01035 [bacterium]
MKVRFLVYFIFFIITSYVYSNKGGLISEFTLIGQPEQGVRGLAYAPADGNIWVAGPNSINNVIFGKFKNDVSHSMVQNWQAVANQYWVFDIGFKYIYSGIDCLVMVDQNSPRIHLKKPSDGSDVGSITDPFSGGTDEGIEGDYKNSWGVTLYASNFNYSNIVRWNGTSWSNYTTGGSRPMGVAYGWAHIFVIDGIELTIYVFKASDGSLAEKIPLINWSYYMIGLSRGRDNYDSKTDTLYTACYYPSNLIYEIDIGNYNQQEIEPMSVGSIKAMFN